MKRFGFICLAALAAPVLAQQFPGAIKPPPPPLGSGQPAPPALPMQPADETARLLRAQTEALRALADRIDQLERRIDRLERGGR